MNTNDILKYVHELDWNCPNDIQRKAINFLSEIDEEYVGLIFHKQLKSTWENAVKVIGKIGFPKNKSVLSDLVWLLQDVNWPGVKQAMEILSSIEKTILIPIIENALLSAESTSDTMWISGINLFVKKVGYSCDDFGDKKIFELLKMADF